MQVIETSSGERFVVRPTEGSDLDHCWYGWAVKRVRGQWLYKKNAKSILVRKLGCRIVDSAPVMGGGDMTFHQIGTVAARVVSGLTPYQEGRRAGYRDEPLSRNPYRKGLESMLEPAAIEWALAWDAGHRIGQLEGRDDQIAKWRENCR